MRIVNICDSHCFYATVCSQRKRSIEPIVVSKAVVQLISLISGHQTLRDSHDRYLL